MAAPKNPKLRAARRSWPPAEKRRIVELTLSAGASVTTIARENGVHPNSVYHWGALYRTGKLDAQAKPAPGATGPALSATFMPVRVVPQGRSATSTVQPDAAASRRDVVQLVLASGATLRIETGVLDAALVCSIIAELQR
jgi:transposase-like protein